MAGHLFSVTENKRIRTHTYVFSVPFRDNRSSVTHWALNPTWSPNGDTMEKKNFNPGVLFGGIGRQFFRDLKRFLTH